MEPLLILAVLALNIALSELLTRRTALRHLGTALLVIVVTAITANLGLLPTYSSDVVVYGAIFEVVAPAGIFLLLLQVGLREVLRAGAAMLGLFLIGALGTVVGVLVGMFVVGGSEAFGPKAAALGGMFVGTYIGGSINFNAIALAYDIQEAPLLFAGANAVDASMTAVWMAATIALPRFLRRIWRPTRIGATTAVTPTTETVHDAERVDPLQLGVLLALGLSAVWFSNWLAAESKTWFAGEDGAAAARGVPSILILTTIALVLAQWSRVRALAGSRLLGLFAVYLLLAVIGAHCDLAALGAIGDLAFTLLIFVSTVIGVHGLITFGGAWLLRLEPEMAAVASQANIGGSTSALALARSLNRGDLVLPGILVGALGSALGTYLGFLTVGILA